MTTFHQQEEPNPSKRCKFFKSTLKHFPFANCHTALGRLPSPSPDEEVDPISDNDQELFVSAIRSRYMEEKSRRKVGLSLDGFSWVLPSTAGESFIAPKTTEEEESDGKEREDFLSVGSCFSRCSSATNMEAFLSARTNLSRCSSLNGLDLPDLWRRSIILELCHCEGWPFGLCRKALLLPPLPKSPAESWSWRKSKSAHTIKLPPPIFLNHKSSEQPLRAGTKASQGSRAN